ncbi:MAG: UbiD family decarboxylase [Deltaproteobacteria bacterium]|nr:UbiD family decarboxylase [Deltaproteobacteria bacterium]
MPYRDLREYLARLKAAGKLRHVARPVDKDWELVAVTRRVFERFPDERRPALEFDVQGFDIPVVVGVLGASREIYALALETTVDQIADRWTRAQSQPVPPVLVADGPVHENVLTGEAVDVTRFPHPVWTVGQDPGPYLTAPCIVSKDPDTGQRNVGTYRLQVKGRDKLGMNVSGPVKGMWSHMEKNERAGRDTPCAIVLGGDPTIGLTAVSPVPMGLDEYAVAGGLRGEPVELVRCRTVDLEVPATAEIVLEGEVLGGVREPEGPFGDYTGYVDLEGSDHVVMVRCVTFRQQPIYHAFFSQMPPSESSTIRGTGREGVILRHLRGLSLPVKTVHLLHAGGAAAYLAIAITKQHDAQPQQVMWAAWAVEPTLGKLTVIVDDDIDVRDPFQINWALSWRVQPARDVYVFRDTRPVGLDPSLPPEAKGVRTNLLASKVGIDATKKHAYPGSSLPPREHLAQVDAAWPEYGLE